MVLSTLHVLLHLILRMGLWSRYYYYPHFTIEKIKPIWWNQKGNNFIWQAGSITSGLVRAGSQGEMGVEMHFVIWLGANKIHVLVPLNLRGQLEGRKGVVILSRLPCFRWCIHFCCPILTGLSVPYHKDKWILCSRVFCQFWIIRYLRRCEASLIA